jgi:hypothetical protein
MPKRCLLALAVIVSLLGHGAGAEEGAELLHRGVELLNQGDFREAEKTLARAVRALPKGSPRAGALLKLGIVVAIRGKTAAAKEAFARALGDDPTVTLDPEGTRPDVFALFVQTRAALSGTLVVEGGPPGATLQIGSGEPKALSGEIRALYSNVFLAVGLGAAVTGAVLTLWPRDARAETRVRVVPTGLGAALAIQY